MGEVSVRAGTGSSSGFTLIELLLVMGLVGVVAGVAVPVANHANTGLRLGVATREVERTLQTARLRSVSTNRPLMVRLNCPQIGELRIVEVTGVQTTDTNPARCDETQFPYPAASDSDPATPAYDGPVRRLHSSIAVTGPDVHFSPNGTAQEVGDSGLVAISAPVGVLVGWQGETSLVTVNGLGKVSVQ